MLGLYKLGNQRRFSTADALEVCANKGILLIEAKDVTEALLKRLESIISGYHENLDTEIIVKKRIDEVERKLDGSINLLNKLLRPIEKVLSREDNICVGLFIDYKLTDVDEFGLTGDIGLLRDQTDDIYIFGSYGTKYFTEDSDIDIAWFTNSHIDLVTRGKFERFLEDVLGISVDLVVVNKDSSTYLLCNIFEFGEIIFEYGQNFSNWFDKFYDETLIDRDLYYLYMEERNRYVQP